MKDKIQHDDASLLAGQPSSPLQPALCVTPLDHLPDPRSPGTRGTRRHERPQWGGRDPAIGIPPARRRLGPAVVPVVPDRGWYLVDRPGCTLAPRQADPLRTRRHAARVRLPVARVRRRGRDPHRGAARRAATAHGTRFQRPDTEPLDDVDAFTRRWHLRRAALLRGARRTARMGREHAPWRAAAGRGRRRDRAWSAHLLGIPLYRPLWRSPGGLLLRFPHDRGAVLQRPLSAARIWHNRLDPRALRRIPVAPLKRRSLC